MPVPTVGTITDRPFLCLGGRAMPVPTVGTITDRPFLCLGGRAMPVPTGVFVSVGGDVPGAPFDPRFSGRRIHRNVPAGHTALAAGKHHGGALFGRFLFRQDNPLHPAPRCGIIAPVTYAKTEGYGMTLRELKPGESAIVETVGGEGARR